MIPSRKFRVSYRDIKTKSANDLYHVDLGQFPNYYKGNYRWFMVIVNHHTKLSKCYGTYINIYNYIFYDINHIYV